MLVPFRSMTSCVCRAAVFEAINGMLLDMLAVVTRKDFHDWRRRQAQGQAKPKTEGPEDTERKDGIAA